MAGLDPAISVPELAHLRTGASWMPGSSPGMTIFGWLTHKPGQERFFEISAKV
jgi:hypothetical protein